MNPFLRAMTVLAITNLAIAATAAPPDSEPAQSGLGFLEAGKDYVIRFPEASNIFKVTRSEVTESRYTTADGKTVSTPVRMNYTLGVTVFQVVRSGGGSWVLLRHPANADDFARWGAQRQAMAILAGPHVEEIRARPDGPERLRKWKDAAAAEIPTSETWVNLDHAIAIAAVPIEEVERKLSVQAVEIKPKE